MGTYVVLRRSGWPTPKGLGALAQRAAEQAARAPDEIAWVHSYVLAESDGSAGLVCVYQASSPEAIRRHSAAAELPVDEIVKVADAVIAEADPTPAAN